MINDKLETKRENDESMMLANHFIMLDVLNTECGKEFDRSHPFVQIIYPSDLNFYHNNQAAESLPKKRLTHKEKRKYLFTISLNLDADY